ncbi:MAG: class I SAM-dependent methyltransferase [Desulfomonilaceae bacterium]
MLDRFIARQLRQPSGVFGRWLTARWLNRINILKNLSTLNHLSLHSRDRVLEVGFGGGELLLRMLTAESCGHVAGIDPSPEMVERAERLLGEFIRAGKANVRRARIEAIPYEAGEFTKLCSVNTIYFWDDVALALSECRRVLKPGGQILLCFSSKRELGKRSCSRYGFRLYDLDEVEGILERAGFIHVRSSAELDPKRGQFYCVIAGR